MYLKHLQWCKLFSGLSQLFCDIKTHTGETPPSGGILVIIISVIISPVTVLRINMVLCNYPSPCLNFRPYQRRKSAE